MRSPPQDDQTGAGTGVGRVEAQGGCQVGRVAVELPAQDLGDGAQVTEVVRYGAQPGDAVSGEGEPAGVGVGLPVPLGPQVRSAEAVALCRVRGLVVPGAGRGGVFEERAAFVADHGPAVVVPAQGLEVEDSSEGRALLEVQKPVLALR